MLMDSSKEKLTKIADKNKLEKPMNIRTDFQLKSSNQYETTPSNTKSTPILTTNSISTDKPRNRLKKDNIFMSDVLNSVRKVKIIQDIIQN
jgi:hypothetical protein